MSDAFELEVPEAAIVCVRHFPPTNAPELDCHHPSVKPVGHGDLIGRPLRSVSVSVVVLPGQGFASAAGILVEGHGVHRRHELTHDAAEVMFDALIRRRDCPEVTWATNSAFLRLGSDAAGKNVVVRVTPELARAVAMALGRRLERCMIATGAT